MLAVVRSLATRRPIVDYEPTTEPVPALAFVHDATAPRIEYRRYLSQSAAALDANGYTMRGFHLGLVHVPLDARAPTFRRAIDKAMATHGGAAMAPVPAEPRAIDLEQLVADLATRFGGLDGLFHVLPPRRIDHDFGEVRDCWRLVHRGDDTWHLVVRTVLVAADAEAVMRAAAAAATYAGVRTHVDLMNLTEGWRIHVHPMDTGGPQEAMRQRNELESTLIDVVVDRTKGDTLRSRMLRLCLAPSYDAALAADVRAQLLSDAGVAELRAATGTGSAAPLFDLG
jgi:hypothetical protein